MTTDQVLERYPALVAHVICHSLGYATPRCAANIILAARNGEPEYCEWISACYHGDPKPAVQAAFRNRAHHTGFMASYAQARALVDHTIETGEHITFASWF